MAVFPEEPVSPRVFMEEVVPALFADVELEEHEHAIDLRLGVVLRSEEDAPPEDQGGSWTLRFVEGELGIAADRQEGCDLTVVQSVADWRAALWEGRPRLVADGVDQLRNEGPAGMRPPRPPGGAPPPDPMKGLSDLKGLIEGVISDDAGSDWRIGVLVGPGPLPEGPQATIRLGAEQAEAMRIGELHPLEALITGQLQLDGDLGLILQLQAVAMTLSMASGGRD